MERGPMYNHVIIKVVKKATRSQKQSLTLESLKSKWDEIKIEINHEPVHWCQNTHLVLLI
jgi:hypothetical protein